MTTMLNRVNKMVLIPLSESAACICIHAAVDDNEDEIILSELQFRQEFLREQIPYPSHSDVFFSLS
jgi:hypothetical protein